MDSSAMIESKKLDREVKTRYMSIIAQSLSELSNNLTRANILECLRGLHEAHAISDEKYAEELKGLLIAYNYDLDAPSISNEPRKGE